MNVKIEEIFRKDEYSPAAKEQCFNSLKTITDVFNSNPCEDCYKAESKLCAPCSDVINILNKLRWYTT